MVTPGSLVQAFAGTAVVLAGRGVLGMADTRRVLLGDVLPVLAVVAWSVYAVGGKAHAACYGGLATGSATLVAGTPLCAPAGAAFFHASHLEALSGWGTASVVFLVLVTSVVAWLIYYCALGRPGAVRGLGRGHALRRHAPAEYRAPAGPRRRARAVCTREVRRSAASRDGDRRRGFVASVTERPPDLAIIDCDGIAGAVEPLLGALRSGDSGKVLVIILSDESSPRLQDLRTITRRKPVWMKELLHTVDLLLRG